MYASSHYVWVAEEEDIPQCQISEAEVEIQPQGSIKGPVFTLG